MSHLIQLKQRIKAISSIKKITQTMKLIAMSSHSKLKKQSESIQQFRKEIKPLICAITTNSQNATLSTSSKYKHLFVLFASEKGLCGSFNSTMLSFFDKHLTLESLENSHVICIGKKAENYLNQKNIKPLACFEKLLPKNLEKIAQDLYEKINTIHYNYESVICLSSRPKTFFIQEAQKTIIVPIQKDPCDIDNQIDLSQYHWIQKKENVAESMFKVLLKINILLLLTNSMLSEQSARFISMDNATRSAENLLKSMKLTFNKLRQAKITRELIELISGT